MWGLFREMRCQNTPTASRLGMETPTPTLCRQKLKILPLMATGHQYAHYTQGGGRTSSWSCIIPSSAAVNALNIEICNYQIFLDAECCDHSPGPPGRSAVHAGMTGSRGRADVRHSRVALCAQRQGAYCCFLIHCIPPLHLIQVMT